MRKVALEISPYFEAESQNLEFFIDLISPQTSYEGMTDLPPGDVGASNMCWLRCRVKDPYSQKDPESSMSTDTELIASPSEYL